MFQGIWQGYTNTRVNTVWSLIFGFYHQLGSAVWPQTMEQTDKKNTHNCFVFLDMRFYLNDCIPGKSA